jgi:hypothetical protein
MARRKLRHNLLKINDKCAIISQVLAESVVGKEPEHLGNSLKYVSILIKVVQE